MSIRNLDQLFSPASVAVLGASQRCQRGCQGLGEPARWRVQRPDVCRQSEALRLGTRAAVVLTAGLHCVSLGEHADADFGDTLDYLASDPKTRAILLFIESVESPRKFMSTARGAARNKPVIVVKAGRLQQGQHTAASHTGALAGSDLVYDAAIRRAGMLRTDTLQQWFLAAETLTRFRSNRCEELTILTNGGGAGVMAADAASHAGVKLADLGEASLQRLDAVLPANWSHGNPIDNIGDAPVEAPAILPSSAASSRSGHNAAATAVLTLVQQVLAQGRDMLTEPEAKAVLSAYGIAVVATRSVGPQPLAAVGAAEALGLPVVLKILSVHISHKSDVGGVALNSTTLSRCRTPRRRCSRVHGVLQKKHQASPLSACSSYRIW